MFDKDKPYNDLPLLPPKAEIESKAILRKAISANRALVTMASYCRQLPNESIFYSTLFLKEAKESSEIENIVTTNDDLYQAFTASQQIINPNTREVLHYVDALWNGISSIKETGVLTTRSFVKIVNTIKENNEGVRKNPGVRIGNKETKEIVYTPPEGEDIILQKLKNLEEYINTKDGTDPLIKMAVIHYQFEAVHPFSDGNGRTGRIINILYLVLNDLLEHPMLFLSKYIIDNKAEYYKRLREVTENNRWEEWILYMLNGIEETSFYMQKKIIDIVDLMYETKRKIKANNSKIYSKDLIEVIFAQPYCKIRFLEDAGIAKRLTATKYLNELEKMGIMKSIKIGKERLYINIEFYKLLKE